MMQLRVNAAILITLLLSVGLANTCEDLILVDYLEMRGPVKRIDSLFAGTVTITTFAPDGLSATSVSGRDMTTYTVDVTSRVLRISYSNMLLRLSFTFDATCRLATFESAGGASPYLTRYEYSSDGRERRTSPSSRGNVTVATLDEFGRMVASTSLVGGTLPSPRRNEFRYNDFGDLVELLTFEGAFVVDGTRYEYQSYDHHGNWLIRTTYQWDRELRSFATAGPTEERVIAYFEGTP